jgi:hypothetical protein
MLVLRALPLPRRIVAAALALLVTAAPAAASFVNFESGHVRPLALAPGGNLLFAVNTPDNRLAIYTVDGSGLTLAAEVQVGLEPVAVAARTNLAGRPEVWVVNHLSDSVSIVEIDDTDVPASLALSRVTRTLLVGDEPRDIVFAGSSALAGGANSRAFVTAAHRGQNRPGDPQLTTEGIGRADVWCFNANNPGAPNLGGTPLAILTLFGDTPRALAKNPSGSLVYAAAFHSGNQTTALFEPVVTANGGLPPAPTPFPTPRPNTGLIVKFNPANGRWEDEIDRDWSAAVRFSLPDRDVFLINADAGAAPAPAPSPNAVVGVGTVLFNMAVRPNNGKLYVANTEALNEVRFEPIVNGHLHESRITIVTGTTPTAVHLNPHVDYDVVPGDEAEESLAFPMDMVFSSDGATLYVAAFGSRKVGVFDAAALEAGSIVGEHIEVGQGPSGLVLDEARDSLYVMNRIDHTISVVTDVTNPLLRDETPVSLRFDPSPPAARVGRRFLYDARLTSGHGDSACASCHVFGDFDSLAWDLGDPFGTVVANPNPFRVGAGNPFHPMKGPMTTQSLRGMADNGPMHWRGDRSGGTDGGNPLDEDLAFKEFNPAFVGLLGRATELTPTEMQQFTDFILTVQYPPNPIRDLDDDPTGPQLSGENFFTTVQTDGGVLTCDFCHRLPLGSDGLSSIEGEPQEFKIAHLRNAYQKIGMFGVPGGPFLDEQVRGFGFLHDGSVDTIFTFVSAAVFQGLNDTLRRNLEAFMLAFDTGLKPAVGQQVSLGPSTVGVTAVTDRIDLLATRADAGDCDLTVKGLVGGQARGAVYVGGNSYRSDRDVEGPISTLTLRTLAASAGQEQVYTCVPPGSGFRIGVDRDEDGFGDRTEIDLGSDPADAADTPSGPTPTPGVTPTATPTPATFVLVRTTSMSLKDRSTAPADPSKRKLSFKSSTKDDAPANQVTPPFVGSAGDPTIAGATGGGATLTVYNSNGSGEQVVVFLPASFWTSDIDGDGFAKYRYRGPSTDAVTKVDVKRNRIQIRGGKAAWGYTLDEPSQGSIAVRLELGTSAAWCANGPAKASGTPPSTARNDKVDKFVAQPKTPPPLVCPALP